MKKLALLSLFPLLFSCEPAYKKLGIKQDNVVEEAVEFVVEQKTGLRDIDLTPTSPE